MRIHLEVLLVEDSEDDIELMRFAFSRFDKLTNGNVSIALRLAYDGEEALQKLNEMKASKVLPDLIFCDINMPKMNGLELIKAIKKSDSPYRLIPFVFLTTSKQETDILKAYENWASGYLCKPVEYKEFIQLIINTLNYWLSVESIPN